MGELFLAENCVYPAQPGWGGVSRRGGGGRNSLRPGSSVQVVLKQWEVKGLDKILTRSHQGFPSGSVGKESACDAGDLGSIPGSGRFPGEWNGNHFSILAWRISWTEKPGGLQPMGSQRVRHDWSDLACMQACSAKHFFHCCRVSHNMNIPQFIHLTSNYNGNIRLWDIIIMGIWVVWSL